MISIARIREELLPAWRQANGDAPSVCYAERLGPVDEVSEEHRERARENIAAQLGVVLPFDESKVVARELEHEGRVYLCALAAAPVLQ